jgi:hypothetical protein
MQYTCLTIEILCSNRTSTLEFEVDNPQSPNTTESSYKQMQH